MFPVALHGFLDDAVDAPVLECFLQGEISPPGFSGASFILETYIETLFVLLEQGLALVVGSCTS